MEPDLLIVSQTEYNTLHQALRDANLDLCYSAPLARPLRQRWTPALLQDAAFRHEIAQRRPVDPSFRIASVAVAKPGYWGLPDQLQVRFHAVPATQDAALQRHLAEHFPRPLWQDNQAPAASATAHATLATYVQVALLLALITVAEVAAFYLPEAIRPPGWALTIMLVLLSICKFGIVTSFFMHLRYDHRLYAWCFVGGLVVAGGTIFALLALFRHPSHGPAVSTVAAASVEDHLSRRAVTADRQPPAEAELHHGQAASGKLVFQKYSCHSCHSVAEVPGAQGTLGPRLDGLAARAERRIPGMAGEAYIRQSVEDPGVHVVQGYLKLMPALRHTMSAQEFADLLAWLDSL